MTLSSGARSLKVLYTFFLITSTIFVTLRVFVRSRVSRNFSVDDCFLLATLPSFSLYATAGLLSVEDGIGSGPGAISDPIVLSSALRFWFVSEILHICTVTLLRISFALHLRNLARIPSQRWVLFTLMSITIVYNVGFSLVVLFQCAPVHYASTGGMGEDGGAMDRRLISVANYGFAVVGAGVDWGLVFVSPWFFWEKEMGLRLKYCLRVLLVMGICAGAAALVRVPTTRALQDTNNFFVDCVPIAVGSILEPGLGMMALAASTFKPLWPSLFRRDI